MSKQIGTDRKARSRNLKGLSVFEDEIAAPADYGDFMKIDAPLSARTEATQAAPIKDVITKVYQPINSDVPCELEPPMEPATKWQQTGNKVATNRQQSGNVFEESTPQKSKSGNKVATQPATLSATKWQQTGNKVATRTTFSALVGLQRALIGFIYQACKAVRSRSTEALTLEHMGACLKSSPGSVKTTLQRLELKGFLLRIDFKSGRGGWSKYELPDAVFHELLQLETENKLATNWQQTENKVATQPATQPATTLPSSSSVLDLDNFKTTTGNPELFDDGRVQLSPDWAAVDFTPLANVGFSHAHLVQLARHEKLSTSEVQDSIHFFAFDLKRNGKGRELKGSPLNFFIGILRKGMPYAPPENYESPQQEARRKYLEGKLRMKEKQDAEEQQIQELEFSEWRKGLSADYLGALVPSIVRDMPHARESSLRAHFQETVWPDRQARIFDVNTENSPATESDPTRGNE